MSEVAGLAGIVGVLQPIATKLYDYLETNKKKKETKEKIYLGLQSEIITYNKRINELDSIIYNKLIPSLDGLTDDYSKTQINSILLINSKLIRLYGSLFDAQINFTIGCKNISSLSGLMSDLNDTDKLLYDFIMLSKEIVLPNDKVAFDQRLYKFFSSYQNDILKDLSDVDINEASIDMMTYISKIKNIIKPAVSKGIITRDVKKDYIVNAKYFIRVEKRIKLDKSIVKNMSVYVPNKLKPLIPIFEEIKKITDEEQRRRYIMQKKSRIKKAR